MARGVYNTYIEDNLRYSQNAPLDMYKEVNTGTDLPAQINLYAVDGDECKPSVSQKVVISKQTLSVIRKTESVTNDHRGNSKNLPG
ncbi:fumarate hydratase [Shigella flexneri]